MSNKAVWIIVGALVLVAVMLYAKSLLGIESINWERFIGQMQTEEVSCTQEAMLCPDGSAVGRVGPSCDFAPCPTAQANTGTDAPGLVRVETSAATSLSQIITTLGVSITPLKVLEDSRCPTDVTCIQAGTVRVQTTLKDGSAAEKTVTFTLGNPVEISHGSITLTDVSPEAHSKTTITPEQYQFTFTISKTP